MNILNKIYILLFPFIINFYPQIFLYDQQFLSNIIIINILLISTYFFKIAFFKINLLNKNETSFAKKLQDCVPIFITLFWGIIIGCILFSLKLSSGNLSIILSLCYVTLSLFSFYFSKNNLLKYFIFLFLEYLTLCLLSFQLGKTYIHFEIFILSFALSLLLISFMLLFYFVSNRIHNELKINCKIFKKEKICELFSIILILFSFYPILLSMLGFITLANKNLILIPFLILFEGLFLKKIFLYKKFTHIKLIKFFIMLNLFLVLFVTYLFFN